MKWNFDIESAEKEKIIEKHFGERIAKKRLKRIAERVLIGQNTERKLNYTYLIIPVAGDGFQTDATLLEVADLDDSDIAAVSKSVIKISDENDELIAEAIGYEFSILDFLTSPEVVMDTLDSESYSDISAGMIMFDKLFPRAAPTGGAQDPMEKKIEHDLITMNPSMIWPEIFGSPYNEIRMQQILSAIEDDEELMVDNGMLITDMYLYPSKCKQAGKKMVSAILSSKPRFLYMTCDVAVDGKYDSSMEKEMISLAEENGMTVEGNDTQGYYGVLIDKGYTKRIEELDRKK